MFGLKYICEFISAYKKVLWQCEIAERDYTGAVSEMKAASDSLSVTWDKKGDDFFTPVKGSEATLNVICENNFEYIGLFTNDPRQYRMTIYREGELFWRGYITPDAYSESFAPPPYDVTIKAIDGFSQLTDRPYLDASGCEFTGRRSLWQIIQDCIGVLELDLEVCEWIDLFSEGMDETISPLKQVYIDMDRVYFVNKEPSFRNLLEICLSPFAAQIFQSAGILHLRRITSLRSEFRPSAFFYTDPNRPIRYNAWNKGTNVLDSCNLEVLPALKKITIDTKAGTLSNMAAQLGWYDVNAWNYNHMITDAANNLILLSLGQTFKEKVEHVGYKIKQSNNQINIKFEGGFPLVSKSILIHFRLELIFAFKFIADTQTYWYDEDKNEWSNQESVIVREFTVEKDKKIKGLFENYDFNIPCVPHDGLFVFILYNTTGKYLAPDGYKFCNVIYRNIEVKFEGKDDDFDSYLKTESVLDSTMNENMSITLPVCDIPNIPNAQIIYSLYFFDKNRSSTSLWHTKGRTDYVSLIQHTVNSAIFFRRAPSWSISGDVFTSDLLDMNTVLSDSTYTNRIYYTNALDVKAVEDTYDVELISLMKLDAEFPEPGDDCILMSDMPERIKASVRSEQYLFLVSTTNKLYRFDSNSHKIIHVTINIENYIGLFTAEKSVVLVESGKITIINSFGRIVNSIPTSNTRFATFDLKLIYSDWLRVWIDGDGTVRNDGCFFSSQNNQSSIRDIDEMDVKKIEGNFISFFRNDFEMVVNTTTCCYRYDKRVHKDIRSMSQLDAIEVLSSSDRFLMLNENDVIKIYRRDSLSFDDKTLLFTLDYGSWTLADQNISQFVFGGGRSCVLWNHGTTEMYVVVNKSAEDEKVVGLHYINGDLYIVRETGIYKFFQETDTGKLTYELEIQSDVAMFPASGGSARISSVLKTYKNGVLIYSEDVSPDLSGSSPGFTLSGNRVTSQSRGVIPGAARSITITATYKTAGTMATSKTASLTLSQDANAVTTYGAWDITASASVATIDARGGDSSLSYSARRLRTYTSGSTDYESGTPSLSWGNGSTGYPGFTRTADVVTASDRGSTEGALRSCVVRLTMGSVTQDVTINQGANAIVSTAYTINLGADTGDSLERAIPAKGGTIALALAGSITHTWSSGSRTSGSAFTPALSVSGEGLSLSARQVVVASKGTRISEGGSLGWVAATYSGAQTQTVTLYQGSNAILSHGPWSVSLSSSPASLPAGGGVSTLSASASRSRGYTSEATDTETATPALSWSNGATGYTGFTLDAATRKITAATRGSALGESRSCIVCASHGGVTKETTITQAANTRSLYSCTLSLGKTAFSPSADTTPLTTTAKYLYLSGAYSAEETITPERYTLTGDGFSNSGKTLNVASRGATVGGKTTGSIHFTFSAKSSNTVTIEQAANVQTYTGLSVTVPIWAGSAAGETRPLKAVANYSYTSGSTTAPDVTPSTTFSGTATGFTVDAAARTLRSDSRGTVVGVARSITVSGVYDSKSTTATLTQVANVKTYDSLAIVATGWTQSAAGESRNLKATATYTYTSGATSTGDVTPSTTFSGTAAGFTVDNTTKKITSASRGTTTGALRTISLSGTYTE